MDTSPSTILAIATLILAGYAFKQKLTQVEKQRDEATARADRSEAHSAQLEKKSIVDSDEITTLSGMITSIIDGSITEINAFLVKKEQLRIELADAQEKLAAVEKRLKQHLQNTKQQRSKHLTEVARLERLLTEARQQVDQLQKKLVKQTTDEKGNRSTKV